MSDSRSRLIPYLERARAEKLSLEQWISRHKQALAVQWKWDGVQTVSLNQREQLREETAGAYRDRVDATWGIASHGRDALPYLLGLFVSPEPDERSDAVDIATAMAAEGDYGLQLEQQLVDMVNQTADVALLDGALLALCHLQPGEASLIAAKAVLGRAGLDGDTREGALALAAKVLRARPPKTLDDPLAWIAAKEARRRK